MIKVSGKEIIEKLREKGLKVTPQRIAILEAIYHLNNHPSADHIIVYIKKTHPNIATGTVYKVLEMLSANQLIKKVKTEKDVMRYDGVIDNHHHLYSLESERIEDYVDKDLDNLLNEYFEKKGINGFSIEEIRLQIKGNFTDQN